MHSVELQAVWSEVVRLVFGVYRSQMHIHNLHQCLSTIYRWFLTWLETFTRFLFLPNVSTETCYAFVFSIHSFYHTRMEIEDSVHSKFILSFRSKSSPNTHTYTENVRVSGSTCESAYKRQEAPKGYCGLFSGSKHCYKHCYRCSFLAFGNRVKYIFM